LFLVSSSTHHPFMPVSSVTSFQSENAMECFVSSEAAWLHTGCSSLDSHAFMELIMTSCDSLDFLSCGAWAEYDTHPQEDHEVSCQCHLHDAIDDVFSCDWLWQGHSLELSPVLVSV
jgi:hypothetical protein